jgi:hypothetical protein
MAGRSRATRGFPLLFPGRPWMAPPCTAMADQPVPHWKRQALGVAGIGPYTNFPCRKPSAGSGRHDRGRSPRRIGRTV